MGIAKKAILLIVILAAIAAAKERSRINQVKERKGEKA